VYQAGSLEIETGTQAVDFGAIVLDNTVPNNFHATSVAEVQNIYYLTQEIATGTIANQSYLDF
jgi:hypothetical protein